MITFLQIFIFSNPPTTNAPNPDEELYPVMKLLTPGSKETTKCGALSLSSSILNGTGSTRK